MKAPDWLQRAFWQDAKRVLRKGLPSSRKVHAWRDIDHKSPHAVCQNYSLSRNYKLDVFSRLKFWYEDNRLAKIKIEQKWGSDLF